MKYFPQLKFFFNKNVWKTLFVENIQLKNIQTLYIYDIKQVFDKRINQFKLMKSKFHFFFNIRIKHHG